MMAYRPTQRPGTVPLASLILLLLASCLVLSCAAETLEVSNVKVGLACPAENPAQGSICSETTNIQITGQGTCIYDGEQHPCTWYGFEFEYANSEVGDEISCVVSTSHRANFGDPTGVSREDANRFEFSIPLEEGSGRYFNPQYTLFHPDLAGASLTNETVCSFRSRELFRYRLELEIAH